MTTLPPFPVDDATLDLLEQALDPWNHGEPDAECSSVEAVLTLLSELGGSDSTAVEEDLGSHQVMRDPGYHVHNVLQALITEVRRLRREVKAFHLRSSEDVVTSVKELLEGRGHKWQRSADGKGNPRMTCSQCPVIWSPHQTLSDLPYCTGKKGQTSEA